MLKEFARMSNIVGARADYVQGGGGNTSVKLGNGLMAIKASGIKLTQVTENDGFAVVEVDTLKDVTAEQGYKPLRPSVETGFHAVLGTYVLHTHPVYANLALCSKGGIDRLSDILSDINHIVVPYVNPGDDLSRAIAERVKPDTQVVFMQNHGVVVTADTADECMRLHDEVNERIAAAYGVTKQDFDVLSAELTKTLYPDQQVYLTLTDTQKEVVAAVVFLHFALMKSGNTAQEMDENAMDFIAGWESEAYRRTMNS